VSLIKLSSSVVILFLTASTGWAASHALAIECRSTGADTNIQLSGTLMLQQKDSNLFDVLRSSSVTLVKDGERQPLIINAAKLTVSGGTSGAQLQLNGGLNASLNIANSGGDNSVNSEVSETTSSRKVEMNCVPATIAQRGFHLNSLIEMPFSH